MYAPKQVRARNEFFEFCCDFIDPGIPTVVCGDFNTVIDRSIDRRGPTHWTRQGRALWPSKNHSRASRIDLIGCPAVWAPLVSSCNVVPCPFSDHAPVVLSSSRPVPIPGGPGRWKCNVSVFQDPKLRSNIKWFWLYWRTRQPFFPSLGKWWD